MYRGLVKRWVKKLGIVELPAATISAEHIHAMQDLKARISKLPWQIQHADRSNFVTQLQSYRRMTRSRSYLEVHVELAQGITLSTSVSVSRHALRAQLANYLILSAIHNARRRRQDRNDELAARHPGQMIARMKRIKKERLERDKGPSTATRHVGVEIEFISPLDSDELGDLLIAEGLETCCTLKEDGSVEDTAAERDCDGSCRDNCECCQCEEHCGMDSCSCECECDCSSNGRHGHEITVVAPEREIRRVLKRLSGVLREAEAAVNTTCGLHVHIDCRARSAKRVYGNLVRALPALVKVIPKSRRNNRYCRINDPITHGNLNTPDRYFAVNPKSYDKHETIEVRLHSGTTDPKKIGHWIELLVSIADSKSVPVELPQTVGELAKVVKIKRRTYQHFVKRQQQFRYSEELSEAA